MPVRKPKNTGFHVSSSITQGLSGGGIGQEKLVGRLKNRAVVDGKSITEIKSLTEGSGPREKANKNSKMTHNRAVKKQRLGSAVKKVEKIIKKAKFSRGTAPGGGGSRAPAGGGGGMIGHKLKK